MIQDFANKIYDKLADNDGGFDKSETDDMCLTRDKSGYVIAIAVDNREYVLRIEEHEKFEDWKVFEPTSMDFEREKQGYFER